MPLVKTIVAPNGATLEFHKIGGIEIRGNSISYTVQSWPSEADFLRGSAALWNTYLTAITPAGFVDAMESAATQEPDFAGASLVPDLSETVESAKIRAWAAMKHTRSRLEFGGFLWDGSTFDSDQQAQARIQGGVQLATIAASQGQPFSIDWTLADNSIRTLSGADMIAVGMELAAHVQSIHATARVLRVQIEAASTIEEVDAIQWPQT